MRPTQVKAARKSTIAEARRQLQRLESAQPSPQWTAEDIEQARALWQSRIDGPAAEPQPEREPLERKQRALLHRRRSGALWIEAL
jgi:hypothetical protein